MSEQVRLLWVEGEDASEFSDLLGLEGNLGPGFDGYLTFRPDGRGDWLLMIAKEATTDDKGRLKVETDRGNTFVFEKMGDDHA